MAIYIYMPKAEKHMKIKLQKPEQHKSPAPTIRVEMDMVRWHEARSLHYFHAIEKCTPQHPGRSADVAHYVCSLRPRSARAETITFCPVLESETAHCHTLAVTTTYSRTRR